MDECAAVDSTDHQPASRQPAPLGRVPRLWPGLLVIAVYWLVRFVGRGAVAESLRQPLMIAAGVLAGSVFLAWWLFGARLDGRSRLLGLLGLGGGAIAALPWIHPSLKLVQRDGIVLLAVPLVASAMLAWLLVARRTSERTRSVGLLAVAVAAWAGLLAVRIDDRGGWADVTWRFRPTAEQKLLQARAGAAKRADGAGGLSSAGPLAIQPGDWPEFRGPGRDSRLTGVKIDTDWQQHPPQLLWKQPIGPGWSSFAALGDYCFTQEQRGDDEATVCYRLDTGAEVWTRLDHARFWAPETGAGPRATPTFAEGHLYAQGATGILNCLDASTGELIWQRDITQDAQSKVPDWGIATSPLVVDGQVIVFAGGGDRRGTIAYHAADGSPAWLGGTGTHSFSSPQLSRLDGVDQILIAHDQGIDALDPASGQTLWSYAWSMGGNGRMVQPRVLDGDRVVLASGYNEGARLLKISHAAGGWQAADVWRSKKIGPLLQ